MGTSGSSRGPGSSSPLIPTWLDEPDTDPFPDGLIASSEGDDENEDPDYQDGISTRPEIEPPPDTHRFRAARRNFSAFAGSGGSNHAALRRAIRDYVRTGTRGSERASRRMGASRTAAGRLLSVFREVQRDGVAATLRRLNFTDLVGRSAVDIFLGVTNFICRDGGTIDEGVARDAWVETVVDLLQLGIENLDRLSAEQIQEVFLTFVANAIQTLLYQQIGINGIRMAADLSAVEGFEAQFRDYIRRGVRDSFGQDFSHLSTLSDQEIWRIVNGTYQNAWELLEAWGDS